MNRGVVPGDCCGDNEPGVELCDFRGVAGDDSFELLPQLNSKVELGINMSGEPLNG